MAIAYCIIGFRCLNIYSVFISTLVPVLALVFIRFIFVAIHCMRSNVNEDLKSSSIFLSYLATIYFPVGDPYWLFCYISAESGLMVTFGSIIAWIENSCTGTLVSWIYPVIFIILFFVIPALIPFAKSTVKIKHMEHTIKKMNNVIHE